MGLYSLLTSLVLAKSFSPPVVPLLSLNIRDQCALIKRTFVQVSPRYALYKGVGAETMYKGRLNFLKPKIPGGIALISDHKGGICHQGGRLISQTGTKRGGLTPSNNFRPSSSSSSF